MRSKSLPVIFLIGIGGMAAMAAVTKIAFDKNEGLRDISKFKIDFREAFAARGVDKVTFRQSPKIGGSELRVTLTSTEAVVASSDDAEIAQDEMADMVMKSFPRSRGNLKLELVRPAGFGCQGESVFLTREFSFSKLKARALDRKKKQEIHDALEKRIGPFEIEEITRVKKNVSAHLCLLESESRTPAASQDATPRASTSRRQWEGEKLEEVFDACAAAIHRHYPVPRRGKLELRLSSKRSGKRLELGRGEYDKRVQRVRLEIAPRPARPDAEDQPDESPVREAGGQSAKNRG